MQHILYFIIVLFCLSAASSVEARIWPFRTPVSTAPFEEQTQRAQPIFEQANIARENGNLRSALRSYRRVHTQYPISAFAPLALLYTGEIQMERRRWDKAVQAFQTLLLRHPDFPRFNEILDRQFEMAVALAEGDGMRLMGIFPYRAYNRSIAHFENIVRNAPFSDLAPFALLNVARIHQHRGNIEDAIDALDRLINNYPNSILVEQAYLELAKTFANLVTGPRYDQGSTREAISYFQDFLILFPDHEQVALAEQGLQVNQDVLAQSRLLIGEFFFRHRSNFRAAEVFFNEAITISPNSPAANRARAYLIRIEEFRERAATDPNFVMPRVTWGDYLWFWRGRRAEFNVDDIDPATLRSVDDLPTAPVSAPPQDEPPPVGPLRDPGI